jgi:hypothetical protein
MEDKKMKWFWGPMFTVLLCFMISPAHSGLIEEMVILERSYIPALVLTNQPAKPASSVAESMRRLITAWSQFKNNLNQSDRGDQALKKAIEDSERHLNEANGEVAAGKRKEAHESLEAIRILIWKARQAKGIVYLPDRLTAFHEEMEEFFSLAVGQTGEAGKLKRLLGELSSQWSNVENMKLDRQMFGFSDEKVTSYAKLVKQEREILNQLASLISSGDLQGLANAARAMKSTFSQTYQLFGDFNGL